MRLDLDNLPSDMVLLHGLLRDMAAVVEDRDGEIERLQTIIKQLQRTQFGRRSERLDPDQLALGLEDLDSDIGRAEASDPKGAAEIADKRPRRKPLPDHLPREEVVIDMANDACPCCGGVLHSIGESVSEMLDWVPAQLRVLRITRPKYACRTCKTAAQAPAPERPIAGGLATPALLAQVLVSKYCDHTPLYRQAQIFARHGVELERSTLAGWVDGACWRLQALHDRLRKDVFARPSSGLRSWFLACGSCIVKGAVAARTFPMNVSHARHHKHAAPPRDQPPDYLAGVGALLLAGLLTAAPAAAQEQGSVSVAIDGATVKFSIVTYKPTSDGPFPTLIFHHGSGNFERPYDPKAVAQWFMARGWAVLAPSRRGRGGSQGMNEEGEGCSESGSLEGADRALRDIEAVTPALITQPFVDRSRIAIGGQSRGGLLSIAWSGKHPEIRAVVNFVGGWMNGKICRHGSAINQSLLNRGVTWGQPSLWLYGDNDLFYSLEHSRANFEAFQAAGGKGVWHDYKPPGKGLNGHQIGQAPQLWTADMEAYLAERGLPSKHGN